MCGRFATDWNAADIAELFDAEMSPNLSQRSWNVSPGSTIAVLLEGTDGRRRLTPAYWSLIPSWVKEKPLKYPTFNARIESVAEKPTFRESARSMRAVIPASGYYEWKNGRPYYFSDPDHTLWLCGLYSWWRPGGPDTDAGADANAEDADSDTSTSTSTSTDSVATKPVEQQPAWELTATILTRDAVGTLATIHDRMPVMIPSQMVPDWLSKKITDTDILTAASAAAEEYAERITLHKVKPLRGDGPELVAAVRDPKDSADANGSDDPLTLLRQ